MSFKLRQYQTDIVDTVRSMMQSGVRSILIQAPTGSGKTCLTAFMLQTAAAKGMDSWFVVHRRELIQQSSETFDDVGIRHGIISSGFQGDARHPIQICSVQTLARRYFNLRKPKLIVWDEAHHVAAASWSKIFKAYPDAYHIGLTATPERLDGTGLGRWFQEMVLGPSVSSLIKSGWLSKYRLFAPSTIDLTGVRTRMGDFAKRDLAEAVHKSSITGDVVKHYRKFTPGKRALMFCVSVRHSQEVVNEFRIAGIRAEHVDGDSLPAYRDSAMRRFRSGETSVLSNCDLFGEGVDVPAIEAIGLLRPTQSLGLYLQQVGRGLRPFEGKDEAIIMDHVGNAARHGLPDDERDWSLTSKKRTSKSDESVAAVKICPACYAAQSPGPPQCKHCGHEFEVQAREIDQVDGELVEVDPAEMRRRRQREQRGAMTQEDLLALAKRRGYKNPHGWVYHIMQARARRKLSKSGS